MEKFLIDLRKVLRDMNYVVGIDPGENTGYVGLDQGEVMIHCTMNLDDLYVFCATIYAPPWHTFVMEEFLLYPANAQRLHFDRIPAARAIGAVEVLAKRLGSKVMYQTAHQAKEMVDDRLLRSVLALPHGMTKHEMDAARHIVAYGISILKARMRKDS